MRSVSTLLIISFLFIFTGCSNDNGTDSGGNTIMPLKIGLKWTGKQYYYAVDGTTITEENDYDYQIYDTVRISKELYYKVRILLNDIPVDSSRSFINRDDGLYERIDFGGSKFHESHFAKYPTFKGERYYIGHTGYVDTTVLYDFADITDIDRSTIVPGGEFFCNVYKWEPVVATNADIVYVYMSPNFGFVKKEIYNQDPYYLKEKWELENMFAN